MPKNVSKTITIGSRGEQMLDAAKLAAAKMPQSLVDKVKAGAPIKLGKLPDSTPITAIEYEAGESVKLTAELAQALNSALALEAQGAARKVWIDKFGLTGPDAPAKSGKSADY